MLSTKTKFQKSRHSNPPIFPKSPFFGAFSRSPGFWNNSKSNVQVIETHIGFSNTCGNGLINLVYKSMSDTDNPTHVWGESTVTEKLDTQVRVTIKRYDFDV